MTHVGKNIKRIRMAKKMTISDVANEHVSRGMISLIENGKTQPSIERLQYIAEQLAVDISELVEEIPKAEIRNVLNKVFELLNNHRKESIIEAVKLMQPILEKNPVGYEAARLYETYAKCLYSLYIKEVDTYDENDWDAFIQKAIELYEELQMEWQVVMCYEFLAMIEFDQANYHETIRIIDQALEQLTVMDSYNTKVMYIRLNFIKAYTYFALGEFEKSHVQLDQVIEFSREQLVLQDFYMLLNTKAWLYYGEKKIDLAREYVAECQQYVQLVKNQNLILEHGLTRVFLEEFFEKDYEKALDLAESFQKGISESCVLSEEVQRSYLSFSRNLQARVLTKLGKYKEALLLFKENPIVLNDRIKLNPSDLATRILANSYEALCHHHLGNQEEADRLARMTVASLHNNPHSAFYHFAREVLSEVVSENNAKR